MALNPQIIGKDMPHGFAGCYARQPDMIVNTRPCGGTSPIAFGTPVMYDSNHNVVPMAGTGTAASKFLGVAAAEIKSSLSYLAPGAGQFAPGEPVGVFQRGSINVKCYKGSPALGGTVYVRIVETAAYASTTVVGGFEAEADSNTAANVVALPADICQWGGPADANGVAELVILTRPMA